MSESEEESIKCRVVDYDEFVEYMLEDYKEEVKQLMAKYNDEGVIRLEIKFVEAKNSYKSAFLWRPIAYEELDTLKWRRVEYGGSSCFALWSCNWLFEDSDDE
tara:strand:- start:627 stop:935 length:309 start_codon:yes stop_codon:yes gene_type:complete